MGLEWPGRSPRARSFASRDPQPYAQPNAEAHAEAYAEAHAKAYAEAYAPAHPGAYPYLAHLGAGYPGAYPHLADLGTGHPRPNPGAAGHPYAQPNAGAGYPQPWPQRYAAAGDRRPGTPGHGYAMVPMAMARIT